MWRSQRLRLGVLKAPRRAFRDEPVLLTEGGGAGGARFCGNAGRNPHLARDSQLLRARAPMRTLQARFLSSTRTPQASPDGGSKTEDPSRVDKTEEGDKGGGIPWSLVAVVGFVGAIVAYFYRGSKNTKAREHKVSLVKSEAVLDKDEVEEIRSANGLSLANFELLRARVLNHYGEARVDPVDFFTFCDRQLGGNGDLELSSGLRAGHLFERLGLRLREISDDGKQDVLSLLTAMTMVLNSTVTQRVRVLFHLFTRTGTRREGVLMTNSQAIEALEGLRKTHQLPTRVLVREVKEYPFNSYIDTVKHYLLAQGVEEISKKYKKDKVEKEGLADRLAQLKGQLAEADGSRPESERDAANDRSDAPYWAFEDFENLLYSRAVCAWGECNAKR